jgi:Domain of unknown function (DUF4833)
MTLNRRALGSVCAGLWAPLSALVLTMSPSSAQAHEPSFGANDLETLFFISKSDDHNRVDYGMRLDGRCVPIGKDPVFPYWREFEPPPPVRTKPMGAFSKLGYGISKQEVLRRSDAGAEHAIQLRQVDRVIYITTTRGANGRCAALVRTRIGTVEYAELRSIFVKLSGPLSVSYIDIKGKDLKTGQPLEERLRH